MNEANYASLSAGLLARKGQAKPAMRPQSYSFGSSDDLGWNDMGGADLLTPEQRAALMPAAPASLAQPRPVVEADAPIASPAIEQQQLVEAKFETPAAVAATVSQPVEPQQVAQQPIAVVPAAPVQRPRAPAGSKAKAAFTLRLDPDRHMQLRLACVYGRKSAQQIVTAALDEYLSANYPDAASGGKKASAN